jgi:hypothetical protein
MPKFAVKLKFFHCRPGPTYYFSVKREIPLAENE